MVNTVSTLRYIITVALEELVVKRNYVGPLIESSSDVHLGPRSNSEELVYLRIPVCLATWKLRDVINRALYGEFFELFFLSPIFTKSANKNCALYTI